MTKLLKRIEVRIEMIKLTEKLMLSNRGKRQLNDQFVSHVFLVFTEQFCFTPRNAEDEHSQFSFVFEGVFLYFHFTAEKKCPANGYLISQHT